MTFIEQLHNSFFGDEPKSRTVQIRTDELTTVFEHYAKPDLETLSYFEQAAAALCYAHRMEGFRQGIAFAMRLTVETIPPTLDTADIYAV